MSFLRCLFGKPERWHDYFSQKDLADIKAAVARLEASSAVELRVKIMGKCHPEADGDLMKQAWAEFVAEGLHNTAQKTGILILVVFEERRFQILADSGITATLPQMYFDDQAFLLESYFCKGHFSAGIVDFIESLKSNLSKQFPRIAGDINELPDDVIVERTEGQS